MDYIRTFNQIDKEDLEFAGGKGANLGEMVKIGMLVPAGFVIGTNAYFAFISTNRLAAKITKILEGDLENPEQLMEKSGQIFKEFESGQIPKEILQEIVAAYKKLGKGKVAVRSLATAEDLPKACFAQLQESFLNVSGEDKLLAKVISCWASLFTPRAIFYREQGNFNHLEIGLAVVIQKMIQAEVSGVMFTRDPVTANKDTILIEAAFGLGELVVGGKIIPDQYQVGKSDLEILSKKVSKQEVQLVEVKEENRQIPVSAKFSSTQKLTDSEILKLAKYGEEIEKHYYFPQDIEWVKAGKNIYILQTRPVTTLSERGKGAEPGVQDLEHLTFNLKSILEGIPASPGIATGAVRILKKATEAGKLKKGEVLITSMTSPDFVLAMKKSAAIVTDRGGRTSHAAIVSRELGIPAVVETKTATTTLQNGKIVTIDGARGKVYLGGLKTNGKILSYDKQSLPWQSSGKPLATSYKPVQTVTKIYLNLAEPEYAKNVARLDVDGVGLLRAEFMIAQIGIHPKKAIADRKAGEFIKKLSNNLLVFAKSFSPRPVIYRATDFKTNEYRNLKGGEVFEPVEVNPMLGFRGAARYLSQPEVFRLELEAIKKVVGVGFDNLKLMIPFVRTPKELFAVKEIVKEAGLTKFPDFELWMMIEVPSNVFILEDFLAVGVDGVSIGSNDLSMLILGVDRDNELLTETFTGIDLAVLVALEKIVKTCRQFGIPCSICGQAPSVFDELVKKLVSWGITSISVSSNAVGRVRRLVADVERELVLDGFVQELSRSKTKF